MSHIRATEPTAKPDINRSLVVALSTGFLISVLADSLYLFFTRWPSPRFSALSDSVALCLAVLLGTAIVGLSKASISGRVVSCIVFAILTGLFLYYFYGLIFIVFVFHDGL